MHNNIMAAGSRDRPPMLALGRYPQWRSRFLRYVDTRPNGEALWKCILSGPYKPTTVLVHVIEATDDSPAGPEHTTVETPTNMSSKNKAHFLAEKEAIHLILTGIGDDIYSTVDACQTAQEISSAPSPKPSIPSRSHTTTRHKGKEIAKPITPPSETASKEDKDTDEEVDEQELEAHYNYMAKIQEVPTADSGTDLVPVELWKRMIGMSLLIHPILEMDDSNVIPDLPDMCEDDIQNEQNDVKSDDEHAALANLKLDVNENKKMQKQLKKANTTLAQELKERKAILRKLIEFEKYKAFNDRAIDYDKLE
nr:ribonuclease H-like domain-containing protein [Tanacetum cinerariifolium]